jgi:hypothetical protein
MIAQTCSVTPEARRRDSRFAPNGYLSERRSKGMAAGDCLLRQDRPLTKLMDKARLLMARCPFPSFSIIFSENKLDR